MKKIHNTLRYSATDIVNYLGCKHLNELDRKQSLGLISGPTWKNPVLELIQQKGLDHERAYVNYLKSLGLDICELEGKSVDATIDAITKGHDIITQARFFKDGYVGIADILKKVPGKSKLGEYHYEVEDTKLAKETKAGTVLQLCLYTELLGELQGRVPENMYVVKPGELFPTETFRFAEFRAYYHFVKDRFQEFMSNEIKDIYPLPVAKCDTCRWWKECNQKWHIDDHLTLIAGIRSTQIKELTEKQITTLEKYAKEENPFRGIPKQGSIESYHKIHKQAQIQLKGRTQKKLIYELLPIESLRGLNRLPKPSKGDIYFDIEGDHFYEDGGLEYLFGIYFYDGGIYTYKGFWAKNRKEEKKAFSDLIRFILDVWEKFPEMHIFHYAPYEPSAVKRLSTRYAVFEEEVDRILRAELFIDLFSVIKESLIASVESYTLKEIEKFTGYTRIANLRKASETRRKMSIALDFDDFSSMFTEDFELIQEYNSDDCVATKELHLWLENIYQDQLRNGAPLERPDIKTGDASEKVEEGDKQAKALYDSLVQMLPEDPDDWTNEDKAKWLLAHQIEFYRREMKSAWWEFFRLNELEDNDLLEERKGISGLQLIGTHPDSQKVPIHTYRYPAQEITLNKGDYLSEPKGYRVGTIYDFSLEERIVHIKKTGVAADIHPSAVFINDIVLPRELVPSLFRFADEVISTGIDGNGAYRAGRDLLLAKTLRCLDNFSIERSNSETTEEYCLRIAENLNNGVLPIQGPPGTGKTYIGGGLIAELAKQGKSIGVTAVSHKVIRNLLDTAYIRSVEKGKPITVKHKGKSGQKIEHGDNITCSKKGDALKFLKEGAVVGGTAWLWADDSFENTLDYLFVDEAGQMSLTHVLTISRAAKNIILLGDPQQLEQPIKGSHPENADISALEHILGEHKTIPDKMGVFLDKTWRLNPKIAEFTSILYYENRLNSIDGLDKQVIDGNSPFAGSGLYIVPVEHEGNQSQSSEEVAKTSEIINHLLNSNLTWTDRDDNKYPLAPKDILVIAPYNAQVSALKEAIPEISIGTVDKFQGQEAPIVIYSLTSSSPQDAPRGMSFLYSPNRLNVATSRAKCMSILVASERLFEAECNTIEQMRWANGLCLFRELSKMIVL